MQPTVYKDMLKAFLDSKMSVSEFETLYLTAIKQEQGIMVEPLHNILQRVFSSVDAYCEDCTPEEEDNFTITEPTLRKEVAEAYTKLEQFLATYKGSYWLNLPEGYFEELKHRQPTEGLPA